MADLYGTDIAAVDDLPDPEELATGERNVAMALSRRLFEDADALEEIGDNEEFDAINLNDWMGDDFDLTDQAVIDDLQQQATVVLLKDPRALTVQVQATYVTGALTVKVSAQGADGPFSFVLGIDGVSAPTFSMVTP